MDQTYKKEILPYAITWIDLESIILSEISQIEKDKYHMILYGNLKINKQNKMNTSSQIQRANGWLPEGRGMCGTAEIGE